MPLHFVDAFLATSADLYQDGRFSVLGAGFDAIALESIPTTVPALAMIVRLRIPIVEIDHPHHIAVHIHGPDGGLIRRTDPVLIAVVQPGPWIGKLERGSINNTVVNLYGLAFKAEGIYRFDFVEGEDVIGSLSVPVADSRSLPPGG